MYPNEWRDVLSLMVFAYSNGLCVVLQAANDFIVRKCKLKIISKTSTLSKVSFVSMFRWWVFGVQSVKNGSNVFVVCCSARYIVINNGWPLFQTKCTTRKKNKQNMKNDNDPNWWWDYGKTVHCRPHEINCNRKSYRKYHTSRISHVRKT